MAPIIHCVRHAQGYHNISEENHKILDPNLTPFGQEQCLSLAKSFPYHNTVDLVVASALSRTIDTALAGFGDDIKRGGYKVIALPDLQEASELPCDTGSSPDVLAKKYADKPVDLGLVKEDWTSKKGRYSPDVEAVKARARDARKWLMARPEKEIVVVTHGGFLHYLTEDFVGSNTPNHTGWTNTEYRTYVFSNNDTDNAHMIETPKSRSRRFPEEQASLDREELAQLPPVHTSGVDVSATVKVQA
ncbi:Hypothetical protein R9X50_00102200 [Acrodontium crateriforme]|uniref:Phosphoglycerate mutase n=1 Tax=Acrodontium crateriforme TaxID=150365 RepID=A0AAQ3LZY6_9PEZI|nr:Hypothetical protein R9X50_00102200 [Acrodontium crateriforme]